MVLAASDYPLLDVFWTMFIFVGWFIWVWMLIGIFSDLFRRHDVSGWAKAGWTVFVLVLPLVGVLIYLISQGRHMGERRMAEVKASQESFDAYVRSVASSPDGHAAEIAKAKELLDSGAISAEEFAQLKAKALAG